MAAQPHERLAQRLERGQLAIRAMLDYWVSRSRRSGRQMEAIGFWAMGEQSRFSHALINRIINGRNGVSLPTLLSMEALNRAIWLWHTQGPEAAIAELGPLSSWGVRAEWVDESIWLPVPDEPDQPLNLGDLAEVAAGRLPLPYVTSSLLAAANQSQLPQQLPRLLEKTIADSGLLPVAGVQKLLAAYPARDEQLRERFRAVLLGDLQLTRDELQEELLAIAEAVRVMRHLEPGSYGPAQLLAELLAMAQE